MTPQELKDSIILLAIQGRLVEQIIQEGSAKELIEAIASDRKKKIRNKLTKENKKVEPITEESIPFDIPDSWEWIRFGDLVYYNMGKTPPRAESEWWGDSFPWVSIADMPESGHIVQTKEKVSNSAISEKFSGRFSKAGTLLMSFKLTVGRVSILDIDAVHNEAIISIYPYADEDCTIQSYLFMLLPYISQYGESKNAIKGKTLNDTSISNLLIPLPPLAEQKRIVAKIEELLPLIDRYEQAWSKLEDFNKRFPVDMQKSILQMAIQGKLVPQIPEEGTGEDVFQRLKPYHNGLKPCKDELDFSSMDFDIPESWTMVELNQLFDFVDYRGKTPTKTSEGVFLITASNIRRTYMDYTRKEYISREEYEGRQSRGITQKGDLLFTTEAPMGNAALCDLDECSCGQRIITFKEYTEETVLPALFMYFILSPQFQQQLLDNCTGTTAKGIKADKLKHFLLPLPPYEEQKRIVAKLEEILPLCERLK